MHIAGRILIATIAVTSLPATPIFASGQYFGRNKVQYEDFRFHVLHTDHFDVYFYPEEEEAAKSASLMAERWYSRIATLFGHDLEGVQPLILYAAHPQFQQTNVISGGIGEGTGGVTESLKRRIVMPLAGPLAETDHVLGHELVHAFQYDLMARNRTAAPAGYRLPLWFMEGMAEYLSLGPIDVLTSTWLRQAAIEGELPRIEDLDDPRFFPYRFGHALWAYVGGRFGDEAVGDALRAAAEGATAVGALESVTRQDAGSLTEGWHRSIFETYGPLLREPVTASDYGRALVTDERNGGTVNVAPSLSPAGDRFVFLSERDLFSIDMYVGDARTGEVRDTIVKTATDPHFDSLQFIQSSGSWSPSGDAFVFGGVSEGQPVVTIVSVPGGKVLQEIDYPDLGEILNPRWSPDGRTVVFSAVVGGLTDLFLLDVPAGTTRRLTEDAFADMQPDWSPDGRRIVFVTDRFSSRPSALQFGNYELAIYDVVSEEIAPLTLLAGADHWDPQWADNGIFFVSDEGGRPNIYRYEPGGDALHQVTALSAGVTGITKLSPALTVSSAGDRMLFTVREENENRIYAVDEPEAIAGRRLGSGSIRAERDGAFDALPPARRTPSTVASWFERPLAGLPEASRASVSIYEPDFDLDFVGQPFVVAGSNRFGSFLGGGVSFLWSDMLGNHQIGLQMQTTGELENVAAIAGYENRDSRWYWGGSLSHIPFVNRGYSAGVASIGGEIAEVEQLLELRQTESRVGGYLAYPFNRAQRLEFSSGFTRYGFSQTAETFAVSLETGEILIDESLELAAPDDLYLVDASAALVYDTSILGPTSPLVGMRYRVEGGVGYGSLDFATARADFRQYFMPVRPVTIAGRLLHYGRYGGQSEDPRLSQLFLGYPHLVRGYQSGSFTADECRADGGCPVFDRLLGSRLLVANLELRFPLGAAFGADPWSGPIPIELAFFGDAGYAWTQDASPDLFGGTREPVTSAGVALRVAVQRFLVLEFDFVRPFERTEKGWLFEFSLQQGF
jgi:Tol biopolymer transport system component